MQAATKERLSRQFRRPSKYVYLAVIPLCLLLILIATLWYRDVPEATPTPARKSLTDAEVIERLFWGLPRVYANEQVEHYLLGGGDPNLVHKEYGPLLCRAAACGKERAVELLLDYGADVHVVDTYCLGGSVLHMARSYPNITKLLITAGADVNARTEDGRTVLEWVCWGDGRARLAVAELLVAAGADINPSPHGTETPLHYAVSAEAESIVHFLVAQGANINANAGEYWGTPLNLAEQRSELKLLAPLTPERKQELVQKGGIGRLRFFQQELREQNAWELERAQKARRIAEYLRAYGAHR